MKINQNKIGANYINGEISQPREDFSDINPATEEVIGYFPQSRDEEIDLALRSAQDAFVQWKNLSRVQRAEYFWNLAKEIEENIEEITLAISLETGKSKNESRAEVIEALHMVQYTFGKGRESCGNIVSSEIPERESYVIRKPKGVVAVVAPWNFPFAIGGFWCASPAILEGNTVVFKPSELTPMVGQITAELFANAKFPPGVFNLLHGDGRVGHKLVSDSRVNHIAFTGSVDVGQSIKSICAHTWGKTCTCEMGSKSAVIVFDDADLDLAVSGALNSAFKLSGQRCVSSGRILVQRSILESFKEKFLSEVKKIHVSDPFAHPNESVNYSVNYGPLINKDQLERVKFFNDHVRSDSDATVLFDGDRFVWSDSQIEFVYLSPGYWLRPFVYQVEWSDKIYLKREVFGPHVAIIPFDDLDDAIRIYNDTEYGLALGVCTSDFKKMKKVKSECDAGMIYFNLGSIGAESHFPFTGVKKSGFGGSSAAGMFENVVHKVAVTVNHAETINFPQGMK